jgi:hypothetical protein
MYIDTLSLTNFRTFVEADLDFVHPDKAFRPRHDDAGSAADPPADRGDDAHQPTRLPQPNFRNVNLLLGDNGSGKSTILQAVALATLGPAASSAQLPLRPFIRFPATGVPVRDDDPAGQADLRAEFRLHRQEATAADRLESPLHFQRRGELEQVISTPVAGTDPRWNQVYESKNTAFFCVGYGPTRRVESEASGGPTGRRKVSFVRGQRMQSLFQEAFPLFPLAYWLPEVQAADPARYKEVVVLLGRFLGRGHYRFTGELQGQEYTFERGSIRVPFTSLSDGYRAFIGWVADLLYHLHFACPEGIGLADLEGVVMVDEVDLHLHPRWQMTVIRSIARALPRMQFIFTSHSPLVAGSLEWMNIITLKSSNKTNRTRVQRLQQSIHGLDADQILLSEFFGMKTTMAPEKRQQLADLTKQVREGVKGAPLKLIQQLSQGLEVAE